jgi:hypothetical protein
MGGKWICLEVGFIIEVLIELKEPVSRNALKKNFNNILTVSKAWISNKKHPRSM